MSEKPDIEYRFFDHARYVEGFIDSLGLRGLTLVMHDWGSKLGFHYARRHESNVRAAALLGSMFMPIASWSDIPDDFRETLRAWRGDAGWGPDREGQRLLRECPAVGSRADADR